MWFEAADAEVGESTTSVFQCIFDELEVMGVTGSDPRGLSPFVGGISPLERSSFVDTDSQPVLVTI